MSVAGDDLDDDLLVAHIWLNDRIVNREKGNRFQQDVAPQTAFGIEPVLLGDGRLQQRLPIDVLALRQAGDPHHELVLVADAATAACRIERERGVGALVAAEVADR